MKKVCITPCGDNKLEKENKLKMLKGLKGFWRLKGLKGQRVILVISALFHSNN